jgi:hypothetical protein
MTAAIARLLPRASATSIANIDTFVTVALFSGAGLLLSLSVLILDQYIPGEWFWPDRLSKNPPGVNRRAIGGGFAPAPLY